MVALPDFTGNAAVGTVTWASDEDTLARSLMTVSGENSPGSSTATGPVRLFPLPNLVMFPHVVQPLHIFEPRYCDLLEDAVAADRQIAIVLLQPGWQRDYEGRPAIAPVACVGKIAAHERLPTGRHNILLRGLRRAAIRRELPSSRPFRQAEVDLLDDFYPSSGADRRAKSQRHLVELARRLLPDSTALHEQLDELLASQVSLGMLTDVFAFTLGFAASVKQRLLAEWNVDRRAAMLTKRLAELAEKMDAPAPDDVVEFPPRFSLN
jgi:Lon protease-like protein